MTDIEKTKKKISLFKKAIAVLIITPFLPVFLLIGILASSRINSSNISVDERFSLSESMKSPDDILKGVYEYSFAYCGDPHLEANSDGCFPDLDKAIRAKRINFVIFGGDLTFVGKSEEYENFYRHLNMLTVPSYTAIGNHDIYNHGWQDYVKYFGPSVYSFYGGNAKFVVIDTASGDIGEAQMEWIRKELKSNKQPLLFVISHMPIYGGSHGIYEFPKTEDRNQLIELLEKYEVDYVLEGHYHAYVDIEANGVRYITSGSFTDGLLDEGPRHFLYFRVYGPNVSIEKVIIEKENTAIYRDEEI